jgi:hypothetical protein
VILSRYCSKDQPSTFLLLGIVSGSESQILLFFRSAVRDSNQVRFESEVVLLPVLFVKKIVRSIFLLSPGDFFSRD